MIAKVLAAWCLQSLTVTIHAAGLSAMFRRASSRLPDPQFWPVTRLLVWVAWRQQISRSHIRADRTDP